LEDSGVGVGKILKWNFKKWERDMDWIDLRTGTGGRLLRMR